MVRAPCCSGEHSGLKKGPWTHEEDQKLTTYLLLNPNTSWRQVPPRAGLLRCGKSCRLRWMNYLRPDIRRGNFTLEEENQIIQLHAAVGNKWAVIASQLPGRTDNEIKNLWNTKLRKQLVHKGLNPINHQPFCNPLLSHYLKQWIKSIENVIITSLTTQSPPIAYNNNSNTNPSYSLHDMSPSSLMSLLPQQFHGSEGFAQPSITETAWEQPNFNSSSWEERSFIENLMLDGSATFPGDLSYCLREELEKNTNDSLIVEEGTDSIASNAEINLEEGLKYWD